MDTKAQTFYKELANRMGFQVGDLVKVLRIAETHELGWWNTWTSPMNDAVDCVFKVLGEDSGAGVKLSIHTHRLGFPCYVLELIEKKKELKKFIVYVKQVYKVPFRVEAENIEEARQEAAKILTTDDTFDIKYDYTLDKREWFVGKG